MSLKRRQARRYALLWGATVAVVALGLLLVVVGQRAYERQLFQAATQGAPCVAAKPDAAAAVSQPLRRYAFEGLSFSYVRGNIDCQMMKPGRAFGDDELPVCTFEYPGVLVVQSGGVTTAYDAPLGQVAVVRDRGRLACHARML